MKKRALVLLAVLLCAVFALGVTASADFGDYSGSSDYDFSYDYGDSDYDSGGWSGGYSDYGGGGGIFIFDGGSSVWVIVITVLVIVLVASGMNKNSSSASGSRARPAKGRDDLTPIRVYQNIDPHFNAAALCEKAANLYVQMQNGWTAKNIESLRPYFTDALFTQMERSLQGYVQRGETNVVERIAVLDVTPLGFYQAGEEDHILLQLHTRITDYTVNDATQQVVRGSRNEEKFMTYEWDMMRPAGTKTGAETGETKSITCPGCGAPLDVNASARCPYCGTVVQQAAQSWVISAIRGIKQETR